MQPRLILPLDAAAALSPEQLPCVLALNLAIKAQACNVTLEQAALWPALSPQQGSCSL